MSSSSSTYSYSSRKKVSAADILTKVKNKSKDKIKPKKNLLEFQPFKAPPLENNQKSPAGYITLIKSFPSVQMLDSLRVDKLPPGGLAGDSDTIILNPVLTHTILGYDGLALTELKNNTKLSPKFSSAVMKMANEYYKGNGTDYGLLSRMKKQLSSTKAPVVTQDETDYICTSLPVPPTSEHVFTSAYADPKVMMHVTLNEDAHPGAPFFASAATDDEEVMATAVKLMTHYLSILPKGYRKLEAYFAEQEHVAESVTLLSAKQDCYERSSYNSKVRPFGVVPLALKMIFTYVIDNSVSRHQNFTENAASQSAFRLSWSGGGANRIMEWTKQDRDPGFYPLTWGDDQYILVVCLDRTKFLLTPDVMGMDMKLEGTTWGAIELYMWYTITGEIPRVSMLVDKDEIVRYLKKHGISPMFYNVVKFFIRFAKDKKILAMKGLVFMLSVGMISGIPGTSYFDIVGSARINYRLSQIPVPANIDGIQSYLLQVYDKSREIGFPFKREDNRVLLYPFTPEAIVSTYDENFTKHQYQPILPKIPFPLTFIGMSFYVFTVDANYTKTHKSFDAILPCTNAVTTGMRTIYNVFPPNVPDREGRKLAAIFGRGFVCFTSRNAYTYLADLFNKMLTMKITPVVVEEDEDVYQPIPLGDVVNISAYPPREYFAKFYMTPEDASKMVEIHIKKKSDIEIPDEVSVVPPELSPDPSVDISEADLDPNLEDLDEESDEEPIIHEPDITEDDVKVGSNPNIPITAPSASSSNSRDTPLTPITILTKKSGGIPTKVLKMVEDTIDEEHSTTEPSTQRIVPATVSKPGLMPPDIKNRLRKRLEREERLYKWATEEHTREASKYRRAMKAHPHDQKYVEAYSDEVSKYELVTESYDKYIEEYERLQQEYDDIQEDLSNQHQWEEDHELTYDEYIREKMDAMFTWESEIASLYEDKSAVTTSLGASGTSYKVP